MFYNMERESIRPFSFIIELLHPDMQHNKRNIISLFSELTDIYTNLNELTEDKIEFSSVDKTSREINKCLIQKNKIVVINEGTQHIVDTFWKTAEVIISKNVGKLKIPLFIYRQCTVRLLASPFNISDARKYIAEKVCNFDDTKFHSFQRPIYGCGLRFVFTQMTNDASEFTIRIESLLSNINTIFLENQARYLTPLLTQSNYLEQVQSELKKTYDFLTENISNFLTQFNK